MTTPSFKLAIPSSISTRFKTFHPQIKKNIKSALKNIAKSPYSGKQLDDELEGHLSYKVGRFRIVYKISRKTVIILTIGPRHTVYEEALYLLKSKKKQ